MDLFNKADFERLAAEREQFCVTIYIPTHESGAEVNKSMDRIAFKNKVQEVKEELEARGQRNITQYLEKAYGLIDDISFWKDQATGLAVFLSSKTFNVFRLPIPVEEFSLIGPEFELTPLLPLLVEDDIFYILSLSQARIRLFRNTTFSIQELDISRYIPANAEEIFAQYNFNKEFNSRQLHFGGMGNPAPNHGRSAEAVHGHNPQDKEYKYITEFLQNVDNGIFEVLKEQEAPVVLAGVEYICAYYKKISSSKNLETEFIAGNPERFSDRELHEEALRIVSRKLNKGRKKDLEKYPVWAGTGKTSYDLDTILQASMDGRIESLFIEEGFHLWGVYDEKTRHIIISKEKQMGDICIVNMIAEKTIENSGKAYVVSREEMPEKTVETSIAATFRY